MSTATARSGPRAWGPGATPGRVLVIDDEVLVLRSLGRILEGESHLCDFAESAEAAEALLSGASYDVVLLDLDLGRDSGLALLERLKREQPELEIVVITGNASIESAVGCIRRGAFDYLAKPFDPHRVRTTLRLAIERRRLVRRNRELEHALREHSAGLELIGSSAPMRALRRKIASLAHSESSVLVRGESGTGKELVARAIHARSPRADGPFVPVDCGALPQSIIESELFGHERGAFTGATGAPGLFRVAHGGTLFLDEVGEIPAPVQAKLLRALQEREVRPLGSTSPVAVDLRIVTATHRDLEAMLEEGTFRSDLLYRLDVVRVEVPALRERREDVPELVRHFIAKHARPGLPVEGIEPEALQWLCRQDWPGNVRELENTIESALALAPGPTLGSGDLRREVPVAPAREVGSPASELPLSLAAYERAALERALAETGGDVPGAAARLGIGRSTLYRKLAQHGLSARPGSRGEG